MKIPSSAIDQQSEGRKELQAWKTERTSQSSARPRVHAPLPGPEAVVLKATTTVTHSLVDVRKMRATSKKPECSYDSDGTHLQQGCTHTVPRGSLLSAAPA